MLLARSIVLLLAVFEIAVLVSAGVLRERFGWTSFVGQMCWLILGCPGTVAIWFAQQVLFLKIAASSPFHDPVATMTIIGGGVITAGVLFYYVFKHARDRPGITN